MGDTVSSPDSYTYGIVRFDALRNVQSRALSDGLQFLNKLDHLKRHDCGMCL